MRRSRSPIASCTGCAASVGPSADSGACSRSWTRTCSSRPRSRPPGHRAIVNAWIDGRFELLASPALIDELADVLARPRFRRWISTATAAEFVTGLEDSAVLIDDPPEPPAVTTDPDDDYLIALARAGGADYLVSGDPHLTDLTDPDPPVLTPRQFLALLDEG